MGGPVNKDTLYEGFSAVTMLVGEICEKIVTPPFHFDHLPNQVPKSLYRLEGLESTILFALFWGVWLPQSRLHNTK